MALYKEMEAFTKDFQKSREGALGNSKECLLTQKTKQANLGSGIDKNSGSRGLSHKEILGVTCQKCCSVYKLQGATP